MRKVFHIGLLILVCGNFGFTQSFSEVAIANGIDTGCGDCLFGSGVSFVDFNSDGLDDLTFGTEAGQNILFYQNNGAGFTLITPPIINTNNNKQVLWIDYDNDGDRDFFVANEGGPNRLFQNDGNFNFSDITSTVGLPLIDDKSYGASFGDYNNDGNLDLYISNRTNGDFSNFFFKGEDDGTFTDITSETGTSENSKATFVSVFFDYNNDGYQDMYIATDKYGQTNSLYKNLGDGSFQDISAASNTDLSIDAMNSGIGDYDNDGDQDIYVTNDSQGNKLLRNNGDETFTEVGETMGVAFFAQSWGGNFFDADNDLDLDLYVCGEQAGDQNTNVFFVNKPENGNFEALPEANMPGDNLQSYSNAIGDFNNDGLPDIVVNNGIPVGPPEQNQFHLWQNTTSNSNNWLKIVLVGTESNMEGIGSSIEIYINGNKYVRYKYSAIAYLAQNSATEHFGLGPNTMVDSIIVRWLSGNADVLYNESSNQFITIVEGSSPLEPCLNVEVVAPVGSDAEFCALTTLPELSVTLDSGLEADWYGNPTGGPLLLQNSLTYTPTSSGIFYVEARDPSNGCTSDSRTPITLIANENPTVNGGLNEFGCLGTPVTFTAVASGGDGNYSFEWPDGLSNTASLTVAPPEHTSYTVTVTDGNGCTGTDLVTAVVYELPAVTSAEDITICEGECATLEASGSDGASPYSYEWTGGETEVCPEATITYTVTIMDDNGCTDEDELIVTVLEAPVPDAGDDANVCEQECYTFAPSASGGAAPYSFEWSSTNQTMVCPTETTNYTLTVTGDNGCSATDDLTLTVVSIPQIDAGDDASICLGDCFTFSPITSGGTAPFTLTWSTGEETVCPTETTTYSVTISDTNGCSSVDEITITVLPLPNVDAGADESICLGECFTFDPSASGGSGNYEYTWNSGSTTVCPIETTTYSVTVNDSEGCSAIDDITITVFSLPVAEAGSDVSICLGECFTFSPSASGGSGSYEYNWSSGISIVCPMETTTYSLTVTDVNGCTSIDEITVTVNPLPQVDAGADILICDGECFTFDPQPSGGTAPYAYEWSSGDQTVCPTVSTTYSVTLTDTNGCTSVDEINITVAPLPFADAGEDVSICVGECFTFDPASGGGTPPYTFNWSSGNTTVCPTQTTTYSLTLTDSNGCSSSDEILVTVQSTPNVDAGQDLNLCLGECYTFTPIASGGTPPYNFEWSEDGSTTVCPEVNSTYEVTVYDANGCSNVDEINITIITPTAPITQQDEICEGDCITYAAIDFNLTSFMFNNNDLPTITFCEPGVYDVEASVNTGCTTTVEFTVLTVAPPLVNAGEDQTLTCEVTEVNIGQPAETGVSYEWSNGVTTASQTVSEPGTYTITATNIALGCTATDEVIISLNTDLPITDAGVDIVLTCANPAANADATASSQGNQFSYSWQTSDGDILNGENTLTPEIGASGTYILTVLDEENGCSAEDILMVTTAEEPTINVESITAVDCPEEATGAATVSGSGGAPGYEYLWSNGSTNASITDAIAGTYSVSVTDQNGCEVVMEIEITEPPQLILALSATAETASAAADGTITATVGGGTPDYEYEWSTGATTSMISGLSPELYYLTITDANGCMAIDSARVNSFDCQNIVAETSGDFYICPDSESGSIQINEIAGGESPYNILWSNASAENSITELSGGHYSSTITDANNCEVILQFDILEEDTIPPTLLTQDITLTLDENGAASFTAEMIDAGSSDNCSDVSFDIGAPNVDCSDLGAFEQMIILADENGNSDTTDILITVVDSTNPEFSFCPDDIVSMNCESVSFELPQAIDNCSIETLVMTQGLASGETFPEGVTPITYTAQDNSGNSTTCSFTVTVENTLEATAQLSDFSCNQENPFTAVLSANGGTPGYTYLWGDGNTNNEVTLAAPGPWSWTVTDSNGCETMGSFEAVIPDTISISLQATAENEMQSNGMIEAMVSGGTGPYTYQWFDVLGNTIGTEEIVTGIPAGLYCLSIVDANGCTANDCTTVQNITQTFDAELNSAISIAPNPTSGLLNVTFNLQEQQRASMILMDINGKLVSESAKKAEEDIVSLNTSQLPEGVYLIRIIVENRTLVKKVMVSR
jgi:hypothetical protein